MQQKCNQIVGINIYYKILIMNNLNAPMKTTDIINILPYSTRKNARYSISSINQMIRSYERRAEKKLSTQLKDKIRFIYILRIILHNYSTSYHSVSSLLNELKEKNIAGLQIESETYSGSSRDSFMNEWKNVAFEFDQILLESAYASFLKSELPLERLIQQLEGESVE